MLSLQRRVHKGGTRFYLSGFLRVGLVTALLTAGLVAVSTAANAQPANDTIAGAVAVTSLPFTNTVGIGDATDTGDPAPGGSCTNNHGVWYQYTATAATYIEGNTIGSSYDTTLAVFSGTPGALTLVGCNDDDSGLQSRLNFGVTAGTTYYFLVGCYAFSSCDTGVLTFHALIGSAPPPPLDLTLSVDQKGSFDPKTGAATVVLIFGCNVEADGFISSYPQIDPADPLVGYTYLRQRSGRFYVTVVMPTSASVSFHCSPPTTRFPLTFRSLDGRFAGGQATLSIGGAEAISVAQPRTADFAEIPATIVRL